MWTKERKQEKNSLSIRKNKNNLVLCLLTCTLDHPRNLACLLFYVFFQNWLAPLPVKNIFLMTF